MLLWEEFIRSLRISSIPKFLCDWCLKNSSCCKGIFWATLSLVLNWTCYRYTISLRPVFNRITSSGLLCFAFNRLALRTRDGFRSGFVSYFSKHLFEFTWREGWELVMIHYGGILVSRPPSFNVFLSNHFVFCLPVSKSFIKIRRLCHVPIEEAGPFHELFKLIFLFVCNEVGCRLNLWRHISGVRWSISSSLSYHTIESKF